MPIWIFIPAEKLKIQDLAAARELSWLFLAWVSDQVFVSSVGLFVFSENNMGLSIYVFA